MYVGLGLLGMQFESAGLLAVGGRGSGDSAPVVLSVEDTSQQFFWKRFPLDLTEKHLTLVSRIAGNVRELERINPRSRLWRGYRSLALGLESAYAEDRLHGFVRALDGVVKTEQRKGRKQFVRRCQLFTGKTYSNERLLNELYQLRNAIEHLRGFESEMGEYPQTDRQELLRKRAYQAELLSRFVFTHILKSEQRTELFADDDAVDRFWQETEDTNSAWWGETFDLLHDL